MNKYTLKDLEMPDDEPMVIIRSSLLWMCDGDKYAAAALNMYVHWTRWLMKRKPVAQEINKMLKKKGDKPTQDTTYIIYRKQEYLVDDLLGFCSDRRLRQANDLLVSKGLLKIEDAPRYLTDHVLKYEVQIGTFKKLMNEWRKQREDHNETTEDEEVEVALEADSDGTDKNPLRNGKLSEPSRSRSGKKSVTERKNVRATNIDNKQENYIDDIQRENKAVAKVSQSSMSEREISLSSFSFFKNLSSELRQEVINLLEKWDTHCGYMVPCDEKHVKAAIQLARCHATIEEVIQCEQFCRVDNPKWVNDHGVDLVLIARYWGKWKSTLVKQQSQKPKDPKDAPSFLSAIINPIFAEIHASKQDILIMTNSIQLNYLEHCPNMNEASFKQLVTSIVEPVRIKYTGEALYGDDAWGDIFETLATEMRKKKSELQALPVG